MAFFVLGGCSNAGPAPRTSSGVSTGPSLVEAPELDLSRLAKTDDCVSCHADVASHWASSVHAYASFDNPWYRASIDDFRKTRGEHESRFCAGCHDPLLLLSGDIDQSVSADNDLAYAGVTCLVCHGTETARADGNGSFTLTDRAALIPDPANEMEIAAHRDMLTMEPLRTAALCGSCHRSFSGTDIGNEHHLPGIDDLGDWASSAYSGAVQNRLVSTEQETCQGCHMPAEPASVGEVAGARDGEVRSHRWAASHTALAAQLPDGAYAEQARRQLEGAVLVDLGAVRVGRRRYLLPREARLNGSESLVFDVLLESTRVGHRFPGGVRDLQDTWVEVTLEDADGRILGVSERRGDDDADVFSLRASVLDANANPERLHRVDRFAAPAFDRTLGAHDARAVRYSMVVPKKVALPLRIDARLVHRKHSPAFQAFACAASRTERGLGFASGALLRGKIPIDPCVEEPITVVGSATAWLGRGAADEETAGGAARPDVDRFLTQARALLHGKQEHVHIAKPSLQRAKRLASEAGSTHLLASVWVLRARLAGLQGRAEQAVALSQRAQALIGDSPVLDRVRGDAFARVWRWNEAAEAYRRVANAAPADPAAWRRLARAYGSLSDDANALHAAETGLALAPRDESLLRSRALALESLDHPAAEEARRKWLAHRKPDRQPALLASCEQAHESCRRDRQPIPHYTLTPPTKPFHASADPR